MVMSGWNSQRRVTPPSVESSSHLSNLEMEPPVEVDTEGTPLLTSGDNITVLPKEDDILSGGQTHTEDQSPASDTTSMAGELAKLHVYSPPHQEPEDDETSQ